MSLYRAAFLVLGILALLGAGLLAGCGGTEGVPLKYSFEEGDAFTYDFEINVNGSVEGPGVPEGEGVIPQDTNLKMRMSMAVKDVTDGVATVSYSYESLEMTSEGQKLPVPPQSIPEITVKIDEQGKIISLEGLEGMLPPGFSLNELPFDPSQFSGQTNLIYPEGGLAEPGDTWEATTTYPLPGSDKGVESKVTGKLLSVSEVDGKQVAEVEFTINTPMDVTLDLAAMMAQLGLDKLVPQGEGLENMSFKVAITGAQGFKGVSRVEVESGAPVDLRGDMDIDMTIEVIDAPAAVVPEDQRGPMNIDMTAKLTLQQVK